MSDIELKLGLSYDDYDALFVKMIYEGYEISYWNQNDTHDRIGKLALEGRDASFLFEDLEENAKVLKAYETLAARYTARGEGLKKLKDIRDRLDAKWKIAFLMSQSKWMNNYDY